MRPHLQCCTQIWSPQQRKSVDLLEQCRGEPKGDQKENSPSVRSGWGELGVVSLEKRSLWEALQQPSSTYRGLTEEERLLTQANMDRRRGIVSNYKR